MMNVDNDNLEPVTDLQLAPAHSDKRIATGLRDPGAGVNAASRVDLTFVASDSLSELVWSPHNGLSLKCADCSITENRPSLPRDRLVVRNMALSLPQGIASRGTTSGKPIDEGDSIASQMAIHVGRDVGEGASLVRSPRSISGVKPEFGSSHGYNAGASDNMEEINSVGGTSVVRTIQKEENTSRTDGKGLWNPDTIQLNRTAETRENCAGQENWISYIPPLRTDEPGPGMVQIEPLSTEHNEVTIANPSGKNEEMSLVIKDQSKNILKIDCFTSELPLEKLESGAENDLQLLIGKVACGQSEEKLLGDKSVPFEASPTNSTTHLDTRKRKGKAFSGGDANEKVLKDKDDSHESVESCNSVGPARLFSIGNEQELTAGSKRAKKQIQNQQGLGSTSFIGQDSSFMNWISNMVKGLNNTNNDEAPSLALTLAHPNHGHESHTQKLITCGRNDDPGSINMGFQTIFQSLYCSNPKEQETKMSNSPKTLSANIVAAPEMCKTSSCSDQNKNSFNLACTSMKDGRNSAGSSLGKRKANSNVNYDSNPPAEAKVTGNVGYRCDPLRSFWITRLSPKTPTPVLNLDRCNQNTSEALECPTDFGKVIPHAYDLTNQKSSEAKENSTEGLVNVRGKELQKHAPNVKASVGFKSFNEEDDQKSMGELNPIVLSPKFKYSEAMASMFAMRLDALKHIVPEDMEDGTTHNMTTCFYCGRSGHDLRDCLWITEIEREDLMRNISSYHGAEESPRFCIRCFQLDHWAISCPMASMSVHTHSRVADAHTNRDGKNSRADVGKHIGSSSGESSLKEKLVTPLCNLVKRKFSEVPKGIFNAVRKLRLSRMEILKLMNSRTSTLPIDGFFLRLRLGKWEEGLGGTGYYVACITGEQREKPPQGSKKPISVNIGGIGCLVESQYISNQDFLEDELMAWWCGIMKSGGKVPSEDHLISKLEERKRWGF